MEKQKANDNFGVFNEVKRKESDLKLDLSAS